MSWQSMISIDSIDKWSSQDSSTLKVKIDLGKIAPDKLE